jgi:type VI secretion system protein ImpE
MDYKDYIKIGDLDSSLKNLKIDIKKSPSKIELRIFYFQLLCILCDWNKAILQLNSISKLSKKTSSFCKDYLEIIKAEKERKLILSGAKSPIILGKPEPWVAKITKANEYINQKEYKHAVTILKEAYVEAPAVAGKINGESFEWISDSDSRFGPLLEIIINGVYYWMPFQRIEILSIEKASDLRDIVWMPTSIKLINGTELTGVIPVRYPNTEKNDNAIFKLSRKTDWKVPIDNLYLGIGQRTLMTDKTEYPLLDTRKIQFKL